MLKKLLYALCILLPYSAYADANIIRGINYDPVHSLAFAKAVGLDDANGMVTAIDADLDKLKELQSFNNGQFQAINHLKTFFTVYSSSGLNGSQVNINIADVVNNWNTNNPNNKITLALGVYEFRPSVDACKSEAECTAWTQTQVQAAIAAANQYGSSLIDRIIIGNEDINDNLNDPNNMLTRITADIQTIKASINDKNIKVGTAQVADMVKVAPMSSAYKDLENTADFLGTNVYPYWGGTAYGSSDNSPVKAAFASYWDNIHVMQATINPKEVIETEEGWPSDGTYVGQAQPSANNEHDYFYYWFYRDTPAQPVAAVSYLFALFDKLPGQGTESHWGIYSADSYSSILNGDFSKPINPSHPLVTFENDIDNARIAAVSACTQNWDGNSQGTCYPIYGFSGSGNIPAYSSKQFMLDTSGQTYASILVTYQVGGNQPRLCYLDTKTLQSLSSSSKIILKWKNNQGDVLCDVK